MHIIVTGSTGLLGEAFLRLLSSEGHKVTAVTRETMDLSDLSSVSNYLLGADFDLLVNPAGMTGLEQCLDAPELADLVNAQAPALMAKICADKGAQFVHFSTDYVFAGELDKLLSEDDVVNPVNDYGVTKRAGEVAVLEQNSSALVCRVSWLFGPGRSSVLDQAFQNALAGKELKFIANKWSIPTYTDDAVDAVMLLVAQEQAGVFHVCSDNAPVSWWEYAQKVVEIAHSLGKLESVPIVEQGTLEDAHFFRAVRPKHTAMSCDKLKQCGIQMPNWESAAKNYLSKVV